MVSPPPAPVAPPAPVIALLTDFGTWDWYVASMKGVMLGIAPQVRLVDIAHQIRPGKIRAASFVLQQCYRDFPQGTVFVCVVDPGVGTARAPVAVRCDGYTFIGPDNGLFSFLRTAGAGSVSRMQIREITHAGLTGKNPSPTFHGRDIFAPAAAHLAAGVPFENLGPERQTLAEIVQFPPEFIKRKILAEIVFVDHFGNGITNVAREAFERYFGAPASVRFQKQEVPLLRTYAEVPVGQPLAYFGSGGWLEIAVNQGSAAERFDLFPGMSVKLKIPEGQG